MITRLSAYYKNIVKLSLKMNALKDIKTFVFLDIETTGLPIMENNRTKITELCMVAVETNHIRLGVFPRVQNKLNFCFNPWKYISSDSEEMTGLSNLLLENQNKFSSDTVNTINSFLSHNQKPICFVAHNGDNFDYPILQCAIQKTGSSLTEEIFCIDSLHAFRQFYSNELDVSESKKNEETVEETACLTLSVEKNDNAEISGLSQKIFDAKKINETTPKKQMVEVFPSIPHPSKKMKMSVKKNFNSDVSFKLSDIYTRLTKRPPIKAHQAEGDVIMLITSAATLGDKFVNWANVNAKNFCDIPPMTPGKKFGT